MGLEAVVAKILQSHDTRNETTAEEFKEFDLNGDGTLNNVADCLERWLLLPAIFSFLLFRSNFAEFGTPALPYPPVRAVEPPRLACVGRARAPAPRTASSAPTRGSCGAGWDALLNTDSCVGVARCGLVQAI